MQRRVFLASRHLVGLPGFLAGVGVRAAVLPFAADPLPDRDVIVRDLLADVRAAGLVPELVGDVLPDADVIVVGGGDPWHLLAHLRRTGLDLAVIAAVDRGVPYVGISAGAIVAGPSLEPQAVVSPFPPPEGADPRGLALVDVVVFPHRDRNGRPERIAAAQSWFAGRFPMVPLGDHDVLRFPDA